MKNKFIYKLLINFYSKKLRMIVHVFDITFKRFHCKKLPDKIEKDKK